MIVAMILGRRGAYLSFTRHPFTPHAFHALLPYLAFSSAVRAVARSRGVAVVAWWWCGTAALGRSNAQSPDAVTVNKASCLIKPETATPWHQQRLLKFFRSPSLTRAQGACAPLAALRAPRSRARNAPGDGEEGRRSATKITNKKRGGTGGAGTG